MKRTTGVLLLSCLGLVSWADGARANINLELRPVDQTVSVGATVNLGLYAVSDDPGNQLMIAADVIFAWDTSYLQLLGVNNSGAVPMISSGLPFPDPGFGLNELAVPADGDAHYLGQNFAPVTATPAGALLTTLQFTALQETPAPTDVLLLAAGGTMGGQTVVYDGTIPNLNVTGTLDGASVSIIPEPTSMALLAVGALLWSRSTARSRRSRR